MPGELVGASTTDTAEQVATALGVTLEPEAPPETPPVAEPPPSVTPPASAPSPVAASPDDEEDGGEPPARPAKPTDPTQRRIQFINAKRREAERHAAMEHGRVEELQRQLDEARKAQAPAPPPSTPTPTEPGFPQLPPEPKEDDFETLAGYHKALIEWNFKKLQAGTNVEQIVQQRLAEEQQKAATATAQQQFQAAMTQIYTAGRQQFPDFDQVLQEAAERGVFFAPPVLQVIFTHPRGAEIAYALSSDFETTAYIQAAPTEGVMTRQLDRYVTEALKMEGGAFPALQAPWQRPTPAAAAVSPLQPVTSAVPAQAVPAPPAAPPRVIVPASAAPAPVSPLGESAAAQPQAVDDDRLDYQEYKRARIRDGAFDIRRRPGAR